MWWRKDGVRGDSVGEGGEERGVVCIRRWRMVWHHIVVGLYLTRTCEEEVADDTVE